MFHSKPAGLGIRLVSGLQLPLDFLDEAIGIARLDHDLIEPRFTRAIEFCDV